MFKLEELKRLAGERTNKSGWYSDTFGHIYPTVEDGIQQPICDTDINNAEFIAYVGTHADAIVQALETQKLAEAKIKKLEKALEEIKFMSTSKAPELNSDDASHYKWIAYACIGIATKALEERGEDRNTDDSRHPVSKTEEKP